MSTHELVEGFAFFFHRDILVSLIFTAMLGLRGGANIALFTFIHEKLSLLLRQGFLFNNKFLHNLSNGHLATREIKLLVQPALPDRLSGRRGVVATGDAPHSESKQNLSQILI